MIKHFPLPDVGEGLTEAEILGWRVGPGDTVTVNQVLVEIETAKASVELPCPWAGTVSELLVESGQTVQVGAPIIAIELVGDAAGAPENTAESPAAAAGGENAAEENNGRVATLVGYGPRAGSTKRRPRKNAASPAGSDGDESATRSAASTGSQAGTASAGSGSRGGADAVAPAARGSAEQSSAGTASSGTVPLAKPPVRKLAKDLGVDLRQLVGSGSNGVITRDDVRIAADGAATPVAEAQPASADREHRVPIKGVRRATAQAVVDSAFTAPHVTEFLTVDVTELMRLRERLKKHPEFQDVKVTPLAFAAKALCLAKRRTPDVNATWDEQAGEIVYKDYVHLGIAAATPRGLVVPKVRDADQMSLRQLSAALAELTETARQGTTKPADMVGGTITITNVGVFGVDTGTPILNPGESAILALGAIREMPWVVDGEVVPRQVCQLAVSFDHRVVDGEQGSRFLADVGAVLSDPGMAMTY